MRNRFSVLAAYRLRAFAPRQAMPLIQTVEAILNTHDVGRDKNSQQYPRRYVRKTSLGAFNKLKRELESADFVFKKSALHRPDTEAFEAEDTYQSVHYILDLAYVEGQIVVELHH